ncbi:methyltransferase domain-containing protein [Carnobacterium gallinarum]|uniref:methyltransferase domain-containing protein n=1 Tax=Carnobacterium gallinarum TaxID=2749 RepID=UPI000555499D|nr:methyltransferase domain-containing protein [Carnobacterium gallinarum]
MKKIELGIDFLTNNTALFQCPVCKNAFQEMRGNSFYCEKGHSFDVAKKGSLYFLAGGAKNEYDKEMLSSRFTIAQAGLFNPLLDQIYKVMNENALQGATLDVGCGEGSQLDYLTKLGLTGSKIGFDISKDAINLASSHFTSAFWCVADLAQSPFASHQYDTILNIFSPSNYQEFKRLLKHDGKLIKVIPNQDYLVELRKLFYQDQVDKQSYQNNDVLAKFNEHFPDSEVINCRYQFQLTEELFKDLVKMTPLGWGASPAAKEYANAHPLNFITIDVSILIG